VAKINVPVEELIQHGKPRAPKGFYFSHWKGQLLLKKRPVINPKKFTDVQRAWVEHFKTFACWSKQPDPRAYNYAHDNAAKTGWYYRDVLERAFSGKLLMTEGEIKITVPTARVKRTSSEALTNNVAKYLTPNASVWDNNVFWNTSVNPSRLTFRTPGLYLVGTEAFFNAVTGGTRGIVLLVNRTDTILQHYELAASATNMVLPGMTLWYFHQNDYLEASAYANANGVTVVLDSLWAVAITPEAII